MKHKKDDNILKLDKYWIKMSGHSLTDTGRVSLGRFLKVFTVERIIEAIDIAIDKNLKDHEAEFKYTCGILNNWKREQEDESPKAKEIWEIIKHWNKLRPQDWKKADEGAIEYLLQTFDKAKIKFYIEQVIKEERGWANFDDVIKALKEDKYK